MVESDLSNEANATTVLPAPTLDSLSTPSPPDVEISWTRNDDSSDSTFDVLRSSDGGDTWTTVAQGVSNTTTLYTDTTTSPGETYQYQIDVSTDHATSTSNTESITTTSPPTITGTLTSSVSGDDITLDLPSVDWGGDEDTYLLYKGESSGGLSQFDSVGSSTPTYTDSTLEDGERFFYHVVATNSAGDSDPSNEVNETTVLPAPSIGGPSVDSSDNVVVPWTNNDDSPDGGIDVERSSDGGSTWTDVATGLSPFTTSYTDTSVSEGETYQYRVERNTDHATATSGTSSITTPFERATSVSGTGGTDSARTTAHPGRVASTSLQTSAVSQSRVVEFPRSQRIYSQGLAVNQGSLRSLYRSIGSSGDGETDAARETIEYRDSAVAPAQLHSTSSRRTEESRSATVSSSSGSVAESRTTTSPRSNIVYASGSTSSSRSTSKSRASSVWPAELLVSESRQQVINRDFSSFVSGSLSASRATKASRTFSSHSQPLSTTMAAELTEVFPSESSADLEFDMVFSPILGFASEWVNEETVFDEETAAYTVVLDMNILKQIDVYLQYDSDGDGEPDFTVGPKNVSRDSQVLSFDELGQDGYYRIIISNMRPPDHLRAVTWGPTRF